MKPVILDAAGDGEHERPPLRWRVFRDRDILRRRAWGFILYRDEPGGWYLLLNAGRWIVGIECTREEGD